MQITCSSCNFPIFTSGEEFDYSSVKVNFCMNCGKKYEEVGVDVPKFFNANSSAAKYQRSIVIWWGFVPVICFFTIAFVVLFFRVVPILITSANFGQSLLLLIGAPMIYFLGILLFAISKGSKKFKELINEV